MKKCLSQKMKFPSFRIIGFSNIQIEFCLLKLIRFDTVLRIEHAWENHVQQSTILACLANNCANLPP